MQQTSQGQAKPATPAAIAAWLLQPPPPYPQRTLQWPEGLTHLPQGGAL